MNLILPIILIAAGAISVFYYRPKLLNNVRELKYMETKSIAELKAMFDQMGEISLDNGYREYVEIKAEVTTQSPVKTPYSEQQVAFCDSKLLQVTEASERYTDSNGHTRTRMNKTETEITSEKTSQTINVKDNSSPEEVEVEITATGCKLDIPKTLDRFEPKANLNRYNYFSSFSFNRYGAETIGFKMVEKTILLHQNLYIIGEAFKVGDVIHIGKPMDSDKPFIVTTKSEEDMVNTTDKNAKIALFGGIGACIIGVLMFISFLIR